MTKHLIVLAIISTIVIALTGCSNAGTTTPTEGVQGTPGPTVAPRKLMDIVNLHDTAEIRYRWAGSLPRGGPGMVIARVGGGLRRWDALTDAGSPTVGSFNVYRSINGRDEVFGCLWLAIPGDAINVNADCTTGGAPPSMDGALMLGLLGGQTDHRIADRTILGHKTSCYVAPFLKEICVDGNGYVLYMSIGSGGQPQTFEATQIVDAIEPFTWPPDSAAERTPTTVDQKTAASALDFPSEFQLSTSR